MKRRLGPCPCGGERVPGQGYCRACRAAYQRRYRGASGEVRRRDAARAAANYLLKKGDLTRQPCEACGATEGVQMHHDDYNKIADVRWLCVRHHADEPKDRLLFDMQRKPQEAA
jgi:hypothetical protein